MDEAKLKKILLDGNAAPKPDENAKKRALNLAVAEFKAHQQEQEKAQNAKKSQGSSFLSRLIGTTDQNNGRENMKLGRKSLMFGSVAAAVITVAIVNGSFTDDVAVQHSQPASSANNFSSIAQNRTLSVANLPSIGDWFSSDDESDAQAGQAQQLSPVTFGTDSAAESEVTPAYRQAIEESNEQDLNRALAKGNSAMPTPVAPPVDRLSPAEEQMASNTVGRVKEAKKQKPKMEMADADMLVEGEAMPASPPVIAPYPQPDYQPNYYRDEGRDKFPEYKPNSFKLTAEEPVSTFSSDVDTASYSFVRRQLNNGNLPPAQAVRVEEMVNYFDYNYPVPETREQPFEPTVTITDSPWAQGRKLMHIGIKGYELQGEKPRSNIVFLLDVSGSMNSPDKLPLLKNSMKMLLDSLNPDDTVAIVVYAGAAGTVLEPTKASERSKIYSALDSLNAGGSTAGGAGIELAYNLAEDNFDKEAVNRVILATDGDFNVGINNHSQLKDYIAKRRDSGIFLSVLGFGQGNYNDAIMQALAQNGNGIAAYIDDLNEARKVLIEEASSSLFPIAKDVKFQIEFNTAQIAEYRLIGYETRHLNREDFNNDKVDAGDIGAGHTVTAIYEFVPKGSEARTMDDLRYAQSDVPTPTAEGMKAFENEYAFLKIRYKLPDEDTSKLITRPVTLDDETRLQSAAEDTRFATAVAAFGQILRGEVNIQDFTLDDVIALAQQGKGEDEFGYRSEFIQLVRLAKTHDR